MVLSRVIPTLLLKESGLVKSVKFKNPRYIGDPINAVKLFNEKEVDELIFLDILASKSGREPNYALLQDIASECFMPLSYGGGVTNCDQIKKLIKSGVEKIVLNHSALKNPEFIREAAQNFGTSTIVVAIDVKKNLFGKYKVYSHVQDKNVDLDPVDVAVRSQDLGAGEVFVNSVDLDGTFQGYDIELIKLIEAKISIPIIACGGAGSLDHINQLITNTHAAAAAGSLFVYYGKHRAVLINYPDHQELLRISK